jgi:hypothetical protein
MASALKNKGMPENLAGRVCRYALNALCSPSARCASTCAVRGAAGHASAREPGARQARTPPRAPEAAAAGARTCSARRAPQQRGLARVLLVCQVTPPGQVDERGGRCARLRQHGTRHAVSSQACAHSAASPATQLD